MGGTKPSTQFPLGKREERKRDRRPPVEEGGIAIGGNGDKNRIVLGDIV